MGRFIMFLEGEQLPERHLLAPLQGALGFRQFPNAWQGAACPTGTSSLSLGLRDTSYPGSSRLNSANPEKGCINPCRVQVEKSATFGIDHARPGARADSTLSGLDSFWRIP